MGLLIDQRNAVRGGSEFFRLKARNVVRRENVFSCSRHELAVHGSSMFSVVGSEISCIGVSVVSFIPTGVRHQDQGHTRPRAQHVDVQVWVRHASI